MCRPRRRGGIHHGRSPERGLIYYKLASTRPVDRTEAQTCGMLGSRLVSSACLIIQPVGWAPFRGGPAGRGQATRGRRKIGQTSFLPCVSGPVCHCDRGTSQADTIISGRSNWSLSPCPAPIREAGGEEGAGTWQACVRDEAGIHRCGLHVSPGRRGAQHGKAALSQSRLPCGGTNYVRIWAVQVWQM